MYMTEQPSGDVVQLINNGASSQVIVSGIPGASAILADPVNNLLYVDRSGHGSPIYAVDPIAKTKTLFANVTADGLSLSPNGKTLFAAIDGGASSGHVLGFDTVTGKQVFDSGFIPNGPDGTAVGTGPLFSNYLFVNTNGGTVVEINLTTFAQTTIATGGSRGDLVSVDASTNTLLLTQTNSIIRLSGASFAVPEPASLLMAVTALWRASGCGRATVKRIGSVRIDEARGGKSVRAERWRAERGTRDRKGRAEMRGSALTLWIPFDSP